jgi:hypothetical protein
VQLHLLDSVWRGLPTAFGYAVYDSAKKTTVNQGNTQKKGLKKIANSLQICNELAIFISVNQLVNHNNQLITTQ